jgi:uncharacterized protein (DUF433 family)
MNDLLQRITVNPAVMTGLPCIRGMRIPVTTLLGLMAAGATGEELLREYPDLEPDDLRACMAYVSVETNKTRCRLLPLPR